VRYNNVKNFNTVAMLRRHGGCIITLIKLRLMNKFSIKFYDKKNCVNPTDIKNKLFSHDNIPVIFQHQVHGNMGLAITKENLGQYQPCLTYDSDYLITNLSQIGIGVLTADCLPIILVDTKNDSIGVVHAGWRGTVERIILNTITHMNQIFKTTPQDLRIFFGPCALSCCYEISEPFINQLPAWATAALKNNCFNLTLCNELLLKELGITHKQIDKSYNECTICNDRFCSYRKKPGDYTRQMSIIWLN